MRELAGDDRSGRFARGRARRRLHEFAREHWVRLSIGFGMLVLPGFAVAAWQMTQARPFVAGVLVGASVAGAVGFIAHLVITATSSASIMMGDQAEQWTAQELRKLQARGWRVVHHVMLRAWDIDHVLVGPGGVIAVETKWSGLPWRNHPDRVHRAAGQAASAARDLSLWLKSEGAPPATGVTVLWGGEAGHLEPVTIEGTTVMPGASLTQWRATLGSTGLTEAQVELIWEKLDRQCRVRDERELAEHPVPSSILATAAAAGLHVGVASSALVAALQLYSLAPHAWLWLPTGLALGAVGWVAPRWLPPVARPYARSWLAGTALSLCVVAWLLAQWWFR